MNHYQLANKLRNEMFSGAFNGAELAYHLAKDPDVAVPLMEFLEATLTTWADLHEQGLHNNVRDAAVFKKAAEMIRPKTVTKPKKTKAIPAPGSRIWE